MGWFFGYHTRAALIKELTDKTVSDKVSLDWLKEKGAKILDTDKPEDFCAELFTVTKCMRGTISGTLYTVEERQWLRKATREVVHSIRFIGVYLIKFYKPKKDDWQGGWGYKPMDESCGPVEVSCPLKYLDMVPDPGSYATEWRKNVREWHARKKRYLPKLGEKVQVDNGLSINGEKFAYVTYVSSIKGGMGKTPEGQLVRGIRKHLVGPWLENEPSVASLVLLGADGNGN